MDDCENTYFLMKLVLQMVSLQPTYLLTHIMIDKIGLTDYYMFKNGKTVKYHNKRMGDEDNKNSADDRINLFD